MGKLDLNRVDMPKQPAVDRINNFREVATGYSTEEAVTEASRCILCVKKNCIAGCPVEVDIPPFIEALQHRDFARGIAIIKKTNSLPGICGRVCPQESQCEAKCVIGKRGAPIAIGRLERFLADWELGYQSKNPARITTDLPSGKRVAVVGSGPAGLTAAAELARLGYGVTIFESLHLAGGVLSFGIPEFRLPKHIVQTEVDYVRSLGVDIRLNAVVGKLFTVDELLGSGYDAVFLGTGAGLPLFLNITGENLSGVYSANEFLSRINLMKAYLFPQYDTPLKVGRKVAVVGGGNVAMDAARCARRLGASVTVIYRRTETEMPARHEEIDNAKEEGIEFVYLANPTRFLADPDRTGWVKQMECQKMALGEPDDTGRPRPMPIAGSNYLVEVDQVIVALGTRPNPLIARATPGMEFTTRGMVIADPLTGKTTKDRVWAGGDVLTGSATVISAMGAGRAAAADINRFLSALTPPERVPISRRV